MEVPTTVAHILLVGFVAVASYARRLIRLQSDREQGTADDIRAATARLLALIGDHVDAGWYVQVVEADAAGRIALFL